MPSDIGTGIFPNGPAQQMARDRERVIRKLVGALVAGRVRNNWSDEWKAALAMVLGPAHTCLICGLKWKTSSVMDLDDWFCSAHCPVCSDWSATLRPDDRHAV